MLSSLSRHNVSQSANPVAAEYPLYQRYAFAHVFPHQTSELFPLQAVMNRAIVSMHTYMYV